MRIILAAAVFAVALTGQVEARGSNVEVVGGRPSGCPHRYCGCASALKVGLDNRGGRWNLARNWFSFPAAQPGPGMADVRRGHVRIIVSDLGNGRYRFYDPNSGNGLTRMMTDVIRGRVVNPGGGTPSATRYASVSAKEPRMKRHQRRQGPRHHDAAPSIQFAQVY